MKQRIPSTAKSHSLQLSTGHLCSTGVGEACVALKTYFLFLALAFIGALRQHMGAAWLVCVCCKRYVCIIVMCVCIYVRTYIYGSWVVCVCCKKYVCIIVMCVCIYVRTYIYMYNTMSYIYTYHTLCHSP